MIWELCLVSKPKFSETDLLIARYRRRLKCSIRFEEKLFKDESKLSNYLVKNHGLFIALDRSGESVTSLELAKKIENWQRAAHARVQFCVGDAYGFSREFLKKTSWKWKLSDLTLPGDFAWLLLWEQLFRAFSILQKTGYHHE